MTHALWFDDNKIKESKEISSHGVLMFRYKKEQLIYQLCVNVKDSSVSRNHQVKIVEHKNHINMHSLGK